MKKTTLWRRFNMAITIRLTEGQEKQLQEAMGLAGEATKSKAVLYLIENSKELIGSMRALKRIQELESEIKEKEKTIAKIKAGNTL
ncbi:MAG: NikA [Inoviridae sp.]|nr:MAG: NikA [Inoviridae sp.]